MGKPRRIPWSSFGSFPGVDLTAGEETPAVIVQRSLRTAERLLIAFEPVIQKRGIQKQTRDGGRSALSYAPKTNTPPERLPPAVQNRSFPPMSVP